MEVELNPRAPEITLMLSEKLKNIENTDDVAFVIKLSYYDANTVFYLKKMEKINFDEYYLEIIQKNNTSCYLDYNFIQEYNIIAAEDVIDLGVV